MKLLVLLLVFLLCSPLHAEVYKRILPDGSVEFTDIPPSENAQPIKLPGLTTIPSTPRPSNTNPASVEPEEEKQQYTAVEITSPTHDSSIRNNAGEVQISLKITPQLGPRDKVLLFLDGKQIGSGGKSSSLTINNISRGTHNLRVSIVDEAGNTLISSNSISFHLIRRSVLTQPGAASSGSPVRVAPQAPRAPTANP